jgi:hypothetical protein
MLECELKALNELIMPLRSSKNGVVQTYLPDVEIFSRAVELALNEDGFFEPKDVQSAMLLLREGTSRAKELAYGGASWAQVQTFGVAQVVRGYRSKLDGSVQPYGVVFNEHANVAGRDPCRADVWCRGRSEKGLELQFLATRMTNADPIPVPGTIMIHPFGRYCNANKLAGEVDTLEVLEHALSQYPIDPKRVAIRGFSMGGAAAWHLAVHYPDKWFAANPGAGFSETPDFLKVFQSEKLEPAWYEQKLWQLYDCPVWVRNLRMIPTVAYSGEIDKQKQAADIMAAASWNLTGGEQLELSHIVAPKTAHKVDPAARVEIEKRLAKLDELKREKSPAYPTYITFSTATLKYNRCNWLTIDGLDEHWKPGHATAIVSKTAHNSELLLGLENISAASIELEADQFPDLQTVRIYDSHHLMVRKPSEPALLSTFSVSRRSDLTLGVHLRKKDGKWEQVSPLETASRALVKKHGVQGPIDDAFMSSFLFVKPSGKGSNPAFDKWVDIEMERAIREWHRQMRGDVRVKSSEELKPEDFENHNLVLWGDPASNPTLAKIADKLPIQWDDKQIKLGDKSYASATHAPVLIYPNPLNPDRYVVLNSSFTYREYDYLNNARQVPKLPDWAILDLTTPPDARWPGKIVDADFFDEQWNVKASR